jgi:4-amino-4-deoxy-L-arabinose transferase-like glycosyltransferase
LQAKSAAFSFRVCFELKKQCEGKGDSVQGFEVIKKNKTFLSVLFICAFLIRAAVFYCYLSQEKRYWQVDSNTYHLIAQGIAQGKGISDPDAGGAPNFYRLPGYPLFLAPVYKIFGDNPKNALWLQILLASVIPMLIFVLALVLFPQQFLLAKLASGYSALHLGLVLYSGFFMTETLFIVLFLLFAIFFFKHLHLFFCSVSTQPANNQQGQVKKTGEQDYNDRFGFCFALPEPAATSQPYIDLYERMFPDYAIDKNSLNLQGDIVIQELLFAGLFLGLASLVRPVGHYLVILSILMLFFSRMVFQEKCARSFALLLGWIGPVAFWLIRNYMLLGHLFFHTLPGGHFLYLSASRVAMHVQDCSYQQARENLHHEVDVLIAEQEKKQNKKLNEIERCIVHEKLALSYFAKRPLLSITFWLTDMLRTCLSLYSAELLYLESGREQVDYFKKDRSIWSMFARYIFPEQAPTWLKLIILLEIVLFFILLLGFALGLCCAFRSPDLWCTWLKVLPFMALFIVIALAGGYARMRLPIEPFLIIFSGSFWVGVLACTKKA